METLKRIAVLFILPFLFMTCRRNESSTTLTFYTIRGSSSLGLIKLFEEPPVIKGFDINIEALGGQDLMAARFISGEAKIGILPPNMAAKIFTSGASDLRCAAVIGTGMLSLLSNDTDIRTIEDLKGKSVEVAGHGATPDFVFKKILRSYGLKPDIDVILGYSLPYPK